MKGKNSCGSLLEMHNLVFIQLSANLKFHRGKKLTCSYSQRQT